MIFFYVVSSVFSFIYSYHNFAAQNRSFFWTIWWFFSGLVLLLHSLRLSAIKEEQEKKNK